MEVIATQPSGFVIVHAGKVVDRDFATEADAWSWADHNIDDQMFDTPNWLADPLKYRAAAGAA